ncbi:hypothetical protein CHARACLAT_032218 [Characodon lateralis]|uniref:Uncharacterized protein n=1 Tax=Characodon lateralis TaxID=208331 RepID=A0ABU7F7S8_9TELE|nr:hypothetical protein [Characodon lateralis]
MTGLSPSGGSNGAAGCGLCPSVEAAAAEPAAAPGQTETQPFLSRGSERAAEIRLGTNTSRKPGSSFGFAVPAIPSQSPRFVPRFPTHGETQSLPLQDRSYIVQQPHTSAQEAHDSEELQLCDLFSFICGISDLQTVIQQIKWAKRPSNKS